jgi:phosphate uptake regulator
VPPVSRELNDQTSVAPAIRLAMVGRYFERMGDHAVNVGERVRYLVTGDEEHLGWKTRSHSGACSASAIPSAGSTTLGRSVH